MIDRRLRSPRALLFGLALWLLAPPSAGAQGSAASPSVASTDERAAPLDDDPARTDRAASSPRAHADVEVSTGLAPQLGLGGLGGLAGTSPLGNLGGLASSLLAPRLDVAFALGSTTYLSVGLSGSYGESEGTAAFSLSGRLSLLFYLEEPRAGAVLPHARVSAHGSGAGVRVASAGAGSVSAALGGGLGFTWLPLRNLGVRVEANLSAGATTALDQALWSLGLGVGAECALVVRL